MKRFFQNVHFYAVLAVVAPLLLLLLLIWTLFHFGELWLLRMIGQRIALEPRALGMAVLYALAICYIGVMVKNPPFQ